MLNQFKCFLAGWAVVVVVCFSGSVHAQIPVTDIANLTNNIQAEIQNITQYVAQYNSLVMQYNQALQTYHSLSGIRNFHTLLNNPMARQFLPGNWAALYDQAAIANNCTTAMEKGAYARCNMAAKRGADMAISAQIQAQIAQRKSDVQSLINQLAATPDAKDTADLQARLAGEQANLATEQAEMQAFLLHSQLQEKANNLSAIQAFLAQPTTPVDNPFQNMPASAYSP